MKTKALFLSMGLFACVAFSPTAFAAPDTGPKAHNDEVFQEFSKAGVSEIDYQIMDSGKVIITRITFTNGRQVVPEQSDHPVAMSKEDVKKYLELMTSTMTVNSTGLAAVVEPDRRTCASSVMKDTYNDLDQSKTVAGLPLVGYAQHSRQMVWVLRPTWMPPHYLRC